MGKSGVIKDGILTVTRYLHGSLEEYEEWMVDENGKTLYPDDVLDAYDRLLYEVPVHIVFDLNKGKAISVTYE